MHPFNRSVCERVRGRCVVGHDEESLAKVRIALQFFPVGSATCVFISPTPPKAVATSRANCNFSIHLPSFSRPGGGDDLQAPTALRINQPAFHDISASLSINAVFPSVVLGVLNRRPGAISASVSQAASCHRAASALH